MVNSEQILYTIGHSTHDWATFLGLLKKYGITALADVRSNPYSRLEYFSQEPLKASLQRESIEYVFLGRELGARRQEPECFVSGQMVFERIAELPLFREGLNRLPAEVFWN